MKEFYTTRDIAEIMGTVSMTITRKINSGKIASVKRGYFRLVPRAEVERLVNDAGDRAVEQMRQAADIRGRFEEMDKREEA